MDTNRSCKDLPTWIQIVSSTLPLTRGITAARELVAGASPSDIAPLLWGELAVGLVYFVFGYFLFKAFEIVAKRRGTLEVF